MKWEPNNRPIDGYCYIVEQYNIHTLGYCYLWMSLCQWKVRWLRDVWKDGKQKVNKVLLSLVHQLGPIQLVTVWMTGFLLKSVFISSTVCLLMDLSVCFHIPQPSSQAFLNFSLTWRPNWSFLYLIRSAACCVGVHECIRVCLYIIGCVHLIKCCNFYQCMHLYTSSHIHDSVYYGTWYASCKELAGTKISWLMGLILEWPCIK